MKIDKSVFTAEELEQYEALIAKAKVDPAAAEQEMEGEMPSDAPKKKPTEKAEVEDMEDTKKSAPEMAPELKAAMDELADLKKSYEMDKMVDIAKKYAPLGKKEDELAKTLYEMKKSNEANYNAYIAILDESLGLVEKSGVFAEVGKSAGGAATGDVESRVQAAADEIMKSDATMTREVAVAKAWTDHPEWIKEYESNYKG